MSGRRASVALVAFLAAAPLVQNVPGQGLGEAAARERREREKKLREGNPPAPAYTNEALEGEGERSEAGPAASEDAGPAASGVGADTAPQAASVSAETYWRQRADDARRAITDAEKALAEADARAMRLLQDRDPLSGPADPNRLQSLEAQRVEARAQAEAARKSLAAARQALADLQEEARRKNVPPGWLRER